MPRFYQQISQNHHTSPTPDGFYCQTGIDHTMSCSQSSESTNSTCSDGLSKPRGDQVRKLICFHPRCNNFACTPCGKKFGKTRFFQSALPRTNSLTNSFWRLNHYDKTYTNSFNLRRHPEALFHQSIGLVEGRISSYEFQGPGRGDLSSPGDDFYTRVSFDEHICFETYYKIDEHTGMKIPSFRIQFIRTLDPWMKRRGEDDTESTSQHGRRSHDWIPLGPDSFLSYYCFYGGLNQQGFPSKTLNSRIQLNNFVTSSIKSITNTISETGSRLHDKRSESYSVHPFTKKESVCVKTISYDRKVHSLKVTFKPILTDALKNACKKGNQITLDLINATSANGLNETSVETEKTESTVAVATTAEEKTESTVINIPDTATQTPADEDKMPALAEPEETEPQGAGPENKSMVLLSKLAEESIKYFDDPLRKELKELMGCDGSFQTLKTMLHKVINLPEQVIADEPVDLRLINKEILYLKNSFVYLIKDLNNKPGALKVFKNDLLFFREDKTIVHHRIIGNSANEGVIQAYNLQCDSKHMSEIKINDFTIFTDTTLSEKDLRLIKAPFYKTDFEPDSKFVHPCLGDDHQSNRLLVVNNKPRQFFSKIDCKTRTKFLSKYYHATQDEAERLVVLLDEAANDQQLTNLLFFLTERIQVVTSGKAIFEGPLAAA